LSGAVTFAVLAGLAPVAPNKDVVASVLAFNVFAALLLAAVIGWEVWNIVRARRRGRAGARLHVRITGLFSVIAAVPIVLVAVVATITLDRGLRPWFSDRIKTSLAQSISMAQDRSEEHTSELQSRQYLVC